MGENSKSERTDHTFNPWIGCTKVSPGCQICYAEEMMARCWGKVQWGPQGDRKRTSDANWDQLRQWNRKARETGRRARVFVASLPDVFEDNDQVAGWRFYFLAATLLYQNLDFLLLTKRLENIPSMVLPGWMDGIWPAKVWVGTSVENHEYATRRIPALLQVSAPVRFLSCEPLMGPVSLLGYHGIHWVIVGGESGPKARPMDLPWVYILRDQSLDRNVAFFFKQMGGHPNKRDRMEDFPFSLRIRQFPRPVASEVTI